MIDQQKETAPFTDKDHALLLRIVDIIDCESKDQCEYLLDSPTIPVQQFSAECARKAHEGRTCLADDALDLIDLAGRLRRSHHNTQSQPISDRQTGAEAAFREAMHPVLRERDRWGDKRFNYGDDREVWLPLGVVRRLCAAYEAAAMAHSSFEFTPLQASLMYNVFKRIGYAAIKSAREADRSIVDEAHRTGLRSIEAIVSAVVAPSPIQPDPAQSPGVSGRERS